MMIVGLSTSSQCKLIPDLVLFYHYLKDARRFSASNFQVVQHDLDTKIFQSNAVVNYHFFSFSPPPPEDFKIFSQTHKYLHLSKDDSCSVIMTQSSPLSVCITTCASVNKL